MQLAGHIRRVWDPCPKLILGMNDDVLSAGFYQQFFDFLVDDETQFEFSAFDAAKGRDMNVEKF